MTAPDARRQLAAWLHEQYGEHTQPNSVRVDSLFGLVERLVAEGAAREVAAVRARVLAVPTYALRDNDDEIGYVLIPQDVIDALDGGAR